MKPTKEQFEREFVCPKCHGRGAVVQEVSIGRGGVVATMLPQGPTRYYAVSCGLCGYTEFYQLAIVAKELEPEDLSALARLAERSK